MFEMIEVFIRVFTTVKVTLRAVAISSVSLVSSFSSRLADTHASSACIQYTRWQVRCYVLSLPDPSSNWLGSQYWHHVAQWARFMHADVWRLVAVLVTNIVSDWLVSDWLPIVVGGSSWSQKIVLLMQKGKTCHGHTHTTQVLRDKQSMFNILVFPHMHIWNTILVRTLF